MTNLKNFVPFKLKISLPVIKTYTDKTKQSINKSTLNNNGKDKSKNQQNFIIYEHKI